MFEMFFFFKIWSIHNKKTSHRDNNNHNDGLRFLYFISIDINQPLIIITINTSSVPFIPIILIIQFLLLSNLTLLTLFNSTVLYVNYSLQYLVH